MHLLQDKGKVVAPHFFLKFLFPFLIVPFIGMSDGVVRAQKFTIEEGDGKEKKGERGEEKGKEVRPFGRGILLLPYEPRLYLSDVDKRIMEATGLSQQQIKKRVRFGLLNELHRAFIDHGRVINVLLTDTPNVQEDMQMTYRSVGYEYEPVPEGERGPPKEVGESENFFDRLFGGHDKKTQKGNSEEGMKNGQIVSDFEDQPRYMRTKILEKGLIEHLTKKYSVDRVLFINQLNIQQGGGSKSQGFKGQKGDRWIKVHYTLFGPEGEALYGSAATHSMPLDVNDLNTIVKEHFRAVGERIADRLLLVSKKKKN